MTIPAMPKTLELRQEIDIALQIWKELLEDKAIDYAYVTGSAVKPWDSMIDYVPEISDVDLHLKFTTDTRYMFTDLQEVSEMTQYYETRFYEQIPEAIHLPRFQLVHLNPNLRNDQFTPPYRKDIRVLFGHPKIPPMDDEAQIRSVDRQLLQGLDEIIDKLPDMLIDRNGYQLWIPLRRLNWRISPSVIRLLSQKVEQPSLLWANNRTGTYRQAIELGYDKIAELFKQYYLRCWDLFQSDMQDTRIYFEIFTTIAELFENIRAEISTV